MRKYLAILLSSCLFLCIGVYNSHAQVPTAPKADSARAPQTFAMIMGISTYKYIRPLTYADKDAELFRDYLKSPAGGSVKDGNIYCLLNEQAMAANFWVKGMAWLRTKNLQKVHDHFIENGIRVTDLYHGPDGRQYFDFLGYR